jgi:hypothetical protein
MIATAHSTVQVPGSFRVGVLALCVLAAPAAADEPPLERPLRRTVPGTAPAEAAQPAAGTTRATSATADESQPREHPLQPAIRRVRESLETLESVRDYEATLRKREFVSGQLVDHTMTIRFREEPFSVYLKFIDENAGREVMYVKGQNQDRLLAHEAPGSLKSLVGTVSLAPDSAEVRAESRHLITDIGLRNMLRFILKRWEEEAKYGECEVQYYPQARLGEAECLVIECKHPRPRKQFLFHTSRLFIDKQTNLPVRSENYGFPARPDAQPPLIEEYTYSNIKTNVDLADRDFDRNNPEYNFR